jgi:hypothetical protein
MRRQCPRLAEHSRALAGAPWHLGCAKHLKDSAQCGPHLLIFIPGSLGCQRPAEALQLISLCCCVGFVGSQLHLSLPDIATQWCQSTPAGKRGSVVFTGACAVTTAAKITFEITEMHCSTTSQHLAASCCSETHHPGHSLRRRQHQQFTTLPGSTAGFAELCRQSCDFLLVLLLGLPQLALQQAHLQEQHMSATHVNHTCQPHMSATHVSHTCQPHMSATHVSHKCQPHMSTTHVSH